MNDLWLTDLVLLAVSAWADDEALFDIHVSECFLDGDVLHVIASASKLTYDWSGCSDKILSSVFHGA